MKKDKITINGIDYIPADSISATAPAKSLKGMKYVICRTYSAGVFAGYLKERIGQEATLYQARRLWYWDGASSLSQLAVDGVSKPENCKFPCEVEYVELTNVIEVLPCTAKAQASIGAVTVWKQ